MSSPSLTSSNASTLPVIGEETNGLAQRFAELLLVIKKRKLDQFTNPQAELGFLTEHGANTLQSEATSAWLLAEDRAKLVCVDHYSTHNHVHQHGQEISASPELSDLLELLTETRVLSLDISGVSLKNAARSLILSPNTRTLLCTATWLNGKIVGILAFEYDPAKTPSTLEELFAASLADCAAALMQSAEYVRLEGHIQHAQQLESLGLLSSAFSHDLNNLVMSIIGSAGLLLTELSESEKSRSRVERIRSAAQRAGDLAAQLSVFLGKNKLAVAPVSLSELIAGMKLLLETAVSKKASLELFLAEDLPLINADSTQLRQLVMNLATNASEALENREGTITIVTQTKTIDRDFLEHCYHGRDLPPGSYVCLEVSDNGAGIHEELQQKIFDPFFSTKVTGRGLGLAGVLGIVRTHGGAVQVTSKVGTGTTFCVLFPRL
ncbi:MAG TPA: ATP-binding protein [Oligoflexia bacterium]|nr:ATP-binding protein [Oligoflexia bacterium]